MSILLTAKGIDPGYQVHEQRLKIIRRVEEARVVD
jgi:hypothetical protein